MKIFNRFICFSICCCLLLGCVFFSSPKVSAIDLSWKDLIKDVDINNGTVTIEFPATPTTFTIHSSSVDTVTHANNVTSLLYHFDSYESSLTEYSIQITPGSNSWLLLTNIPDNTELNIWLELTSVKLPIEGIAQPAWDFSVGRYNAHMYLYDESHEKIATRTMEFGEYYFPGVSDPNFSPEGNSQDTIGLFYASTILSDVVGNFEDNTEFIENAHFFRGSYFFENLRFFESYDLRLSVRSYEMVLHLADLLESEGEYSEILLVILDELKDRGQTIDFITGEIIRIPAPVRPEGSDVVDSMIDLEENFSGSVQGGYDNALAFTDNVAGVLSSYGPALLAVSSIIDKATQLPAIESVLVVSVSLGLFGFLVNLANTAISKSRSDGSKSSKKGKGG